LKILHVTPSYYPAIQFGGPIQSVHLLNKNLVTHNVEVDVLTTNAGLKKYENYNHQAWVKQDEVRVKYFPYYGYIHYNFSPQLFSYVQKHVHKYDIVHITAVWNFPVWAAALACKRAGRPYIISPRGTIYPETVALKSTLFKKIYYALFARYCLKNAAGIHYTALDEQEKVNNFLKLPTHSFVIPNGIDLTAFSDSVHTTPFASFFKQLLGKKYLLFLSRINIKKGLDLLVESFSRVVKEFPDIMLVIAGPDNEGYGSIIKQRIADKGLSNNTLFTGMISGEVRLAAYRDATVFVLPSYSENFGMSVVEAMACGTPVVISDQVGIYRDIEQQQAGMVCSLNVEEIASAILTLLQQEAKRADLSKKAVAMVRRYYNIEKVSKSFIEKYLDLTQTH
jgi:glycosyltransferase involved in cell wall biosynthesis